MGIPVCSSKLEGNYLGYLWVVLVKMKFCKKYEEYMQGKREKDFPGVGLKKLKKVLKRCRRDLESQRQRPEGEEESKCPSSCAGNWIGHSFPFLFVFLFDRACCSAASVTIVDGLKAADPKAKCPLCRQERVFDGALHLDELNILLSRRSVVLTVTLFLGLL
ncbi:hypothetical protein BHM03_00022110 [Ensete ventricosum]|nr:hypothetical protein BHM03_00022110 [Ensete ventricosum]